MVMTALCVSALMTNNHLKAETVALKLQNEEIKKQALALAILKNDMKLLTKESIRDLKKKFPNLIIKFADFDCKAFD